MIEHRNDTPYIVAVDDDREVLRAIGRDLRQKYRSLYRIMTVESPTEALEALHQMKKRRDSVALFLVDQRMPVMCGVDFLKAAMEIYPDACRVLLTAYADSEAAISAINKAQVQYYLTKPWDPPEQRLYPHLDDLLDEWLKGWRPQFAGWRLYGYRWSSRSHELKDFLSRNDVPYQWIDVEAEPPTDVEVSEAALPLLVGPDGAQLQAPSIAQVAERLGMPMRAGSDFYDLIIVGGGPAGLAAAVYGASEGLKTVLVEREAPGGQAGTSSHIDNYLGFPQGLSGAVLARRAVEQAERFGVEILKPREAVGLRADGNYRYVTLDDGSVLRSYAVVIATGLAWRRLPLDGAERLQGAGVYYGASLSEAVSCHGENVFMVGGANSAGQAAVHFSQYARQVTMLLRGPSLDISMSHYLIEQIGAKSNILVRPRCEVVGLAGDKRLERITIMDRGRDHREDVDCGGLYIFIGAEPRTDWLRGVIPLDDRGFVLSGPHLPRTDGHLPREWPLERDALLFETMMPGVFVAGDVRHESVKRCAAAVGEGSMCVYLVHQHLSKVR